MRANCIICSDLFDESNPISVAKCGHVYHSSCLTIWIGQSKTCPHCRARVTLDDILKLYFNFPPKYDLNSSEIENEISNLKSQLSAKDVELVACKKDKSDILVYVRQAEKKAADMQQEVYKLKAELSELRMKAKSINKLESKILKLEQMNVAMTNDIEHLNNVQTIVNGTQKDAENILNEYNNHSEASRQLATYCICLKRELQKVMESKSKLIELNSKLKRDNAICTAKAKQYENLVATSSKKFLTTTPNKNLSQGKNLKENSTLQVNGASSSYNSSNEEMDVSPLSVPFNKTKFNKIIKTTNVYKHKLVSQNYGESTSMTIQLDKKQNDDSSVIRTGYNGFGGHSNFVNPSRTISLKTLKKRF